VHSKRLDRVALFAALALFLSIVELVIPKPIPFFRIGLANLPLLIALTLFTPREFILLVFLKIFGQGIVSGTLFSYVFMFSAAGSFSSGLVMLLLRRWYPNKISLIGIGVLGALASNSAQLLFASAFIFGRSTWLIAPLFLLVGTITGVILGGFAAYLLQHSRWLSAAAEAPESYGTGENIKEAGSMPVSPVFRLVTGLCMIPPFLLQTNIPLKLVHILFFALASVSLGKRIRILPGVMIAAAVTGAQLLTPIGEVIAYIGSFPVTSGALQQGFVRALNLVGLVYVSRYTVSSDLPIPGKLGMLLYRVFYYFEELTAYRVVRDRGAGFRENIKQALLGIDLFLFQLSGPEGGAAGGGLSPETSLKSSPKTSRKAGNPKRVVPPLILLCLTGLQWILYALGVVLL